MMLTKEKLMQYDLLNDIESHATERLTLMLEFLEVHQRILTSDAFIRDCPSFPGSTTKILRNELVSSVGATLAIEGTHLSTGEIEATFDKADRQKVLERKEREAENSRRAYQYIVEIVQTVRQQGTPFTYREDHIREIHARITEGIDYVCNVPGEFRDINPIFGEPPKRSLCEIKAEVAGAISGLVAWLNAKGHGLLSGNEIVKAIMAHYYLAEIHPFADGNGRTARALEALVMYMSGINNYCFWSLANFWSANRNEYLIHLHNIRVTCDPFDFIMWGMRGYLHEIERIKGLVLKKAKQLMLMDYVRWLIKTKKQQPKEKKLNQRVEDVLELLTHTGDIPLDKFLASAQVTTLYHKSNANTRTRYRDFDKMLKSGLIRIYDEDTIKCIGPNYQLLETLEYRV